MSHPVLELLRRRRATDSRPGHRLDDDRLALVLEGGGTRGAFGGGMVCELERRGMLAAFDDVYGSSAGALNGAWLVCGRAERSVHGWWEPESLRQSIGLRNALRGRPVVDGDTIVDVVYEHYTPMGFAEILASPVRFHPVGTDADSGAAVDLSEFVRDKASLKAALRATMRLPLLSGPPIELAGRRFVDGGIAANIPVAMALEQGATAVLVLRTKEPSLAEIPSKRAQAVLVSRWMRRHAPGVVEVWRGRNAAKLATERLLHGDRRIYQVSPGPEAPTLPLVGSSSEVLRRAVGTGRRAMREALDDGSGSD